MLEAKIIEIELSNESQAGVNWASFANSLLGGKAVIGVGAAGATLGIANALSDGVNSVTPASSLNVGATGRGFYGLGFQSPNFAALLNFLQTQGNAQVLSSPRIATLNNQKAVLKVGSDELYVTGVSTTTTSSGSGNVSTPSLTFQPFFSGIALDVTPQIDDAGHVILHVHPSISTVTEKTKNVDLGALGAYRLPLAASTVNETDSIVRVNDGQIVAIGGLMQQATHDDRSGVTGLANLPVVGGLFRQRAKTNSKHELVILMKPTVIRDDGEWPQPEAGAPVVTPAPASR
jgi:MSHA biogenesis protein MshL